MPWLNSSVKQNYVLVEHQIINNKKFYAGVFFSNLHAALSFIVMTQLESKLP